MKLCVQVSKISLVDLAGSERADSSGAKGTRLKVRGLTRVSLMFINIYLHLQTVSCAFTVCLYTGRSKH